MNTINLTQVYRIAVRVTTGNSGNIGLPEENDGLTYILAPFALGQNYFIKTWVAAISNTWYLTVTNPNTGATINNAIIDIRYLVIKIKHT